MKQKTKNNITSFLNFFSIPQVRTFLYGLGIFLLIWISFDICEGFRAIPYDNASSVHAFMAVGILFTIGYFFYLVGKKETSSKIWTLIFIAGAIMRVGYAFYTGPAIRQHDVEMYYGNWQLNLNGSGHFSYIYQLYSTWKLPSTMNWQFYHPPLWHFLVAVFLHIYGAIEGVSDFAILFRSSMIVSSFVGVITLYVMRLLLEEITENKKVRFWAFVLLAFHPQFFIMSGWVNNDGLALLLSLVALLYAIRFYKKKSWKNAIVCAISFGLAVCTKVSSGMIAIPLAIFLFVSMRQEFKEKRGLRVSLQAASFVGIALLLGGWFPLRTYLKFGIAALSVPGLDPNTNAMSLISYSFWQRFGLSFPFARLNDSIFCILRPNESGYLDYNAIFYTWKCAIFGEYSFYAARPFAVLLYLSHLLLSIFSIFAIVWVMVKERKKPNGIYRIAMLVIFVAQWIAYFIFQILYPMTCTQDFRYLTLILLPGAYFVAKFMENIETEKYGKWVQKGVALCLICFACFSTIFYIFVS